MPALQWLDSDAVALPAELRCPVCAATGQALPLIRVDPEGQATVRRHAVVVVKCQACRSAWCPNQDLDHSYPAADPAHLNEGFWLLIDHYVELVGGLDWRAAYANRLWRPGVHRVLEVGCNVGLLVDYVQRVWGVEAVGLEPSAYGLAGRERLGVDVRTIHSADHLAQSPEPYDVVISTEVIEHVDDPVAFLADIRRLLSRDGTVLISTPNAEGLTPDRSPGEIYSMLSVGAHRFLLSAQMLRAIAHRAGFEHVEIEEHPTTLIAFLANAPFDPPEISDPRRRLLEYHASRASGELAGRSGLADLLGYYCLARDLAEPDELGTEARIDHQLAALFGVDVRNLGCLVRGAEQASDIFEFGRLAPFTLPRYLFWRGHRDDLSERERTEMWEAAVVLVGRGMAADPVNLFLLEAECDRLLMALSGRESGRWRLAARAALRAAPELHGRVLADVKPQVHRRVGRRLRRLASTR